MFGGIAIAYNRLLHLGRLIGGNLHAGLANGQKDHASCLGNADAGGDILTEEQLFDGYHIGLCHFQKLLHILINDL